MTMITPSYLGETIEYSSLHACRSTLEDPTRYQLILRPVVGGGLEPLANRTRTTFMRRMKRAARSSSNTLSH